MCVVIATWTLSSSKPAPHPCWSVAIKFARNFCIPQCSVWLCTQLRICVYTSMSTCYVFMPVVCVGPVVNCLCIASSYLCSVCVYPSVYPYWGTIEILNVMKCGADSNLLELQWNETWLISDIKAKCGISEIGCYFCLYIKFTFQLVAYLSHSILQSSRRFHLNTK
jgi:hypothetical protein